MTISKKSVILIQFSILFLSTASIGMVSYMPLFLEFMNTSKPLIQLIMTIFPLTLFIFPPILGKYSDKIQNRILFVIVGATGVVFSAFMLIFTKDLISVILLLFCFGFFGASYRTIFTLYSELVRNNQSYISIYNALSTGGWFLGTQSGGIIIDIFGIRIFFVFISIISLINLIIVVFIKENRSLILEQYQIITKENPSRFNEEKTISRSIYYGLFFRNFGVKPIITVLSLIIGIHLSSTTEIGFLIGLNFLIQVFLMLLMGHVITEKNNKIILMVGYLFSTIAILGYIYSNNFLGFLIAQIFVAFSYSMFWSASVIEITQKSSPMNRGKYMGYANTSTFSGGFIGGLIFSLLLILFNSDYDIAMYVMLLFPLISVFSILLGFKKKSELI